MKRQGTAMAKTLKDRIDNFKGGFLRGTDANFDLAFDHSLPKRP